MPATPAPVVVLLAELVRRGVELVANGDRLRYRPRSALTPELVEHVKARKTELLALLRARAQGPQQSGRDWPMVSVTPRAGRIGRPDAPGPRDSCGAPRELSLAERVEIGYVNPGWTARAWADRLRQLADRCEALRPELAAQYRAWAANTEQRPSSAGDMPADSAGS